MFSNVLFQSKVQQIVGTTKAITVFSSAKYPHQFSSKVL